MSLDDSQKAQVTQWVKGGMDLAQVQTRLKEDFGVNLTYMDVRFLVDDLNVELQDAGTPDTEPHPERSSGEGVHFHQDEAPEPMAAESMQGAQEAEAEVVDFGGGAGGGTVSVSVDKVTRPGAVVSGDVTFSDGTRAGWQLDQMGRLGLVPPEGKPEFRPSEADLQQFQTALQQELQKQGF